MIIIKRLSRLLMLTFLVCVCQTASAYDGVRINRSGNQATSVVNESDFDFTLTLYSDNRGNEIVNLPARGSRGIDEDCYQIIYKSNIGQGSWRRAKHEKVTEPYAMKTEPTSDAESASPCKTETVENKQPVNQDNATAKESKQPYKPEEIIEEEYDFKYRGLRNKSTILKDFKDYIETHSYYGLASIDEERAKVESCIDELAGGVANPKQYASVLQESIMAMEHNLEKFEGDYKDTLIGEFLNSYTNNALDKEILRDSINVLLDKRLAQREENMDLLKNGLAEWEMSQPQHKWTLHGLIVGIAAILIGLILWLIGRKRHSNSLKMPTPIYNPEKT